MRRLASPPVLVSVALLAALAVLLSQAVTFAVVLLAPEPRPQGFSLNTAAEALMGQSARTSDGRALERRIGAQPISLDEGQAGDPLARTLTAALAQRLGAPVQNVQVRIERRGPAGPHPLHWRRRDGPPPPMEREVRTVIVRRDPAGGPPPPLPDPELGDVLRPRPGPPMPGIGGPGIGAPGGEGAATFTILADRLTFDPFAASLKLPDGRWATVEPPRSLLSPWQTRLLISLAVSMLLLAPLVWWMARRLTRPIRAFAEAAQRLGADPDAPPLDPTGPREVRTAIAAFNEMQASLKGHIRQRTQTIAAIAHDLRTPLTRLRFRAELAPDELRDRMAADVEEMDALIGQAMAYVRGETAPERREALDLGRLAGDCARGFSETGADVSFDGGVALPVRGDPAALRRAVGNLIENAVKFAGAARVRAYARDGLACVAVEDDGPGLSEAELDTVFEPFARGERSRSRETGGAGLGLAVARQAARAAGGDVTLANREAGGLKAVLSVPLT